MKYINPDKVRYIIIHCTDTTCNNSLTVSDVRKWHLSRGFEDIGYHYLIRPDGTIMKGRDVSLVGAHCLGYNDKSIGVCYVGGRDRLGRPSDTRTYAQKVAIEFCMLNYIVPYFPNLIAVLGHNDFSTKTCPNFDAKFEYRDFLNRVRPCIDLP